MSVLGGMAGKMWEWRGKGEVFRPTLPRNAMVGICARREGRLDATCPVYIDFGDESLVPLETCDDSGLPCVRLVAKRTFVHDRMVETSAVAIATRFYRLTGWWQLGLARFFTWQGCLDASRI